MKRLEIDSQDHKGEVWVAAKDINVKGKRAHLVTVLRLWTGQVPHKVKEKHALNKLLHYFSPRPCLKSMPDLKEAPK